MKIAICSDVHLEFGQLKLENTQNAEVLILSGDICTAIDLRNTDSVLSLRYLEFFAACSRNFPHVVYVMGNHEHYNGDFATSLTYLKDALKQFINIHILEKEFIDIGDHRFIGGTLWTDMNGGDERTMNHTQRRMNDFRLCRNSLRQDILSPQDTVEDHKAMLKVIADTYSDTPSWMTIVVVGHHAPSKSSEHPRYANEPLMNGAYNSNLDEFIMDRPGIKLWTHGHTHEEFEYMIAGCRVVCNPRGYITYEDRADHFELKYVDI